MYSLVMSELDVVKEKINYLKVWLGIFVVTLISLVGWVVTNYETVSLERLGVSYVAILWLFISIHLLNKKILEKINSLGDM